MSFEQFQQSDEQEGASQDTSVTPSASAAPTVSYLNRNSSDLRGFQQGQKPGKKADPSADNRASDLLTDKEIERIIEDDIDRSMQIKLLDKDTLQRTLSFVASAKGPDGSGGRIVLDGTTHNTFEKDGSLYIMYKEAHEKRFTYVQFRGGEFVGMGFAGSDASLKAHERPLGPLKTLANTPEASPEREEVERRLAYSHDILTTVYEHNILSPFAVYREDEDRRVAYQPYYFPNVVETGVEQTYEMLQQRKPPQLKMGSGGILTMEEIKGLPGSKSLFKITVDHPGIGESKETYTVMGGELVSRVWSGMPDNEQHDDEDFLKFYLLLRGMEQIKIAVDGEDWSAAEERRQRDEIPQRGVIPTRPEQE